MKSGSVANRSLNCDHPHGGTLGNGFSLWWAECLRTPEHWFLVSVGSNKYLNLQLLNDHRIYTMNNKNELPLLVEQQFSFF